MRTNLLHLLASATPSFHADLLHAYKTPTCYEDLEFDRNATVDLSRVRGVWHPDYCNFTWGDLMRDSNGQLPGHLKRLDICLRELCKQPGYYLSRERKHDWGFYSVDDDLYVSTGHHRTVVARYFLTLNDLPPVVHGVTVMTLTRAKWLESQSDETQVEYCEGCGDGHGTADTEVRA